MTQNLYCWVTENEGASWSGSFSSFIMEMPGKIVGWDADCSEIEISSDPPGRCRDRTWNYSQGRSWRRGWGVGVGWGGRALRHVTDEAAKSGRVQGAKMVTNWISEVKIIDIMRSTIFILSKQITKHTISNCNFIRNFTISQVKWNTNLMQHCAGFISAGSLYMFRA